MCHNKTQKKVDEGDAQTHPKLIAMVSGRDAEEEA